MTASDFPNVNMESQTSKEQCLENSKGKAYTQPNYPLNLRAEYSHFHIFTSGKWSTETSKLFIQEKYIGLGNRRLQLKTEGFPMKDSPSLMSGQSLWSSWGAGSRKVGFQWRPSQEKQLTGRKPDVGGKQGWWESIFHWQV